MINGRWVLMMHRTEAHRIQQIHVTIECKLIQPMNLTLLSISILTLIVSTPVAISNTCMILQAGNPGVYMDVSRKRAV